MPVCRMSKHAISGADPPRYLSIGKRKINLSRVFASQSVGTREVSDKIWLVSFMAYVLGFFDEDENSVEPGVNPFMKKV